MADQVLLCKANCGFFGNPSTDGLCSICFKKTNKSKPDAVIVESIPTSSPATSDVNLLADQIKSLELSNVAPVATASKIATPEATNVENVKVKKTKKLRCELPECKRKLGLLPLTCRCGGNYCGIHRYSNCHNCTFDYKAEGRQQLQAKLPLVEGEKIRKI